MSIHYLTVRAEKGTPVPDIPTIEFTITNANLDTGLRGYPVGTCETSYVDPQEGVSYVGYPIAELAFLPSEDIIHLLFNKTLPTDVERQAVADDIAERSEVSEEAVAAISALPPSGHPMDQFCAAIQILGMTGKTDDYYEDALNLVARTPAALAAIFRNREGWGDPIPSEPARGYVNNFVHMLGMPGGDEEALTRLLSVYYNLHADHGGGNLSTFTGRAVASGLADMYRSMTSGMNALAGPRHGMANQDAFKMVRDVNTTDHEVATEILRKRLAGGGLIFGFGHAVLRREDPRAKVQLGVGEELCPDDYWFNVVKAVREAGIKVLSENPKVSNPYPNVDLISGSLVHALGFTDPDYYTTLFGWSRIAGIGAQIVDERTRARNGRGVAIYRPRYIPVNQPARSLSS